MLYQIHITEQFTKYPRVFFSHSESGDMTTFIYFLNSMVGGISKVLCLMLSTGPGIQIMLKNVAINVKSNTDGKTPCP